MTTNDPSVYWRALISALGRFNRKNGWVMSSHVAMSMMLALFPFVLFTVALSGAVAEMWSTDVQRADMINLVFGAWPDQISEPIVSELNAVLSASGSKLMTIGGILTLYFASNGVDAVRVAMTQAYHEDDTRPFWRSRLVCMGFVMAGGAGVLAIAVLELALPLYTSLLNAAFPDEVTEVFSSDNLSRGMIAITPILAVLACHRWLPGHSHTIREIFPGVILTVVLWVLAGWGFAYYIAQFASYSATYAGLAGAMAALIFLYLNAAILILGAEFNGALLQEDPNQESA
ncbi:YihY/virulence factor BrkB family protein [Aliisedimentitalea scapharcae]|uniref:YihY/virulence factor BrkB family protein n=1 Tax=Aliisedimentitalea scapharcae TaxID=1524259 RepID=A0ABZ2XN36_9RHOB